MSVSNYIAIGVVHIVRKEKVKMRAFGADLDGAFLPHSFRDRI